MIVKDEIKKFAEKYFNEIIEIRRHIHKHPELSFHEFETSKFIQSKLNEYNIPFKTGYAKTGIIGYIKGGNHNKKIIALRADMDALPIQETSDISFKSINNNVMHACGHDAHCASLLGTAKILKNLESKIDGTILLIFQPAEERYPGGANIMIQDGALNNPEPEIIIGQHVLPDMPAGYIGFKDGNYMASGDEVHITLHGKGGHAAMPHNLVDIVLLGSQIILNLNQIISRFVPATIPAVLSFGKFIANGSTNVIPDKVEISGTLRVMNEEWRTKIKKKINDIINSTAKQFGSNCDIVIHDGYPMVYNNPEITNRLINYTTDFIGSEFVKTLEPRMTSEDFGYFSQKYPSCYYRFGVEQTNKVTGDLHTSYFNLNEDSLKTSMSVMAWLAYSLLTH
ncbi:MAG: amidohydrolase [Marinilabiliaceae bacterium]|nr:amidohydrolase [Marinilabiliaceae bacterium]